VKEVGAVRFLKVTILEPARPVLRDKSQQCASEVTCDEYDMLGQDYCKQAFHRRSLVVGPWKT
jgi:hypothetical protein